MLTLLILWFYALHEIHEILSPQCIFSHAESFALNRRLYIYMPPTMKSRGGREDRYFSQYLQALGVFFVCLTVYLNSAFADNKNLLWNLFFF
jgi:hypothetical protein